MIESTLKKYWLSEREIKIYLVSLQYWSLRISTLARIAQENRVTTYSVCENLERKNVGEILSKNNVKYFVASSPQRLLQNLEQQYKEIENIIPELAALENNHAHKPRIRYFEWEDWLKELYLDMLSYTNSDIKTIIWPDTISEKFKSFLDETFIPTRAQKNIFAKVLMPKTDLNIAYQRIDEESLRQTKIIDNDTFNIQCEINLYGDAEVSFAMFWQEEMSWVIISSKHLHTTLESLFTNIRDKQL